MKRNIAYVHVLVETIWTKHIPLQPSAPAPHLLVVRFYNSRFIQSFRRSLAITALIFFATNSRVSNANSYLSHMLHRHIRVIWSCHGHFGLVVS